MDESLTSLDFTNLETRLLAYMERASGQAFRCLTGRGLAFKLVHQDLVHPNTSGRRVVNQMWFDECARIEDLRGTKAATANPMADVLIPSKPKPGDNVKNLRLTVLKQRW